MHTTDKERNSTITCNVKNRFILLVRLRKLPFFQIFHYMINVKTKKITRRQTKTALSELFL